jgi:hypothetical protein
MAGQHTASASYSAERIDPTGQARSPAARPYLQGQDRNLPGAVGQHLIVSSGADVAVIRVMLR